MPPMVAMLADVKHEVVDGHEVLVADIEGETPGPVVAPEPPDEAELQAASTIVAAVSTVATCARACRHLFTSAPHRVGHSPPPTAGGTAVARWPPQLMGTAAARVRASASPRGDRTRR